MKDFNSAERVHKKLQTLHPDRSELMLDYARFLYETGKIGRAENALIAYSSSEPDNAEANLMLAQINIWNGDISKARKRVLHMMKTYPDSNEFDAVLEEINSMTAPVVGLSGSIQSDDQPLKSNGLHFYSSWHKSKFLSPTLEVDRRNYSSFEDNYTTTWLKAGNAIYFKTKTTIAFNGGIFAPSAGENTFLTKAIGLKQQLLPALNINFNYEETPYQYTTSSIEDPFLHTSYKAFLALENKRGLLGETGHLQQVFPDNNTVRTSYLWFLLPLVQSEYFNFNAGYSVNFSTADNSTFTVIETAQDEVTGFPPVARNPNTTTETMSFYDPYFTPKKQLVNSLLSSVRIGSDKVNFNTKLNFGFLASADAPVFEGTNIAFYKINYTPFEVENVLNVGITKQCTLGGHYGYQSLFFFKNHTAALLLTYKFI